jgi:hypothetical protein
VNFLLQSNGGYPTVNLSFSFRQGRKDQSSVLRQFYPLDRQSDDVNLDDAYEVLVDAGRMPAFLLPIGDDVFGNQICLAVAGDNVGAVFFWDHEQEPDPEERPVKFNNLYVIAPTFPAFLDSLEKVDLS